MSVDNYVFGPEIGRGAYGEVFSAVCKRTRENVAIKRLKEKTDSWEESLKLREVAALRVLNQHPHVLKLREVFREEGKKVLYLVFEYLPGGNLHQVLKIQSQKLSNSSGSLSPSSSSPIAATAGASVDLGVLWPLSRIRDVMYQLFSAVDYVHRMGFFHRDIKPENVMFLTKSNKSSFIGHESKKIDDSKAGMYEHSDFVKLVDFGLARRVPPRALLTKGVAADDSTYSSLEPAFSNYVATRWYRAPELVLGAPYYSTAVDIWALGCILAELISGRPLFPGISTDDQLFKIVSVIGTFDSTKWPTGISLLNHSSRSSARKTLPLCAPVDLVDILPRADSSALALLNSIFQWDPLQRPTAQQCLESPFFSNCKLPSIPKPKLHSDWQMQNDSGLGSTFIDSKESDNPELDYVVSSSSSSSSLPFISSPFAVGNASANLLGDHLTDDVNAAIDDEDDFVNSVNLISWSRKRNEAHHNSHVAPNFSKNRQLYIHAEEEDDYADSPRMDADEEVSFENAVVTSEEEGEPLVGLEEDDEFADAIKESFRALHVGTFASNNPVDSNGTSSAPVCDDLESCPKTIASKSHSSNLSQNTNVVYRTQTQPSQPFGSSGSSFPSLPTGNSPASSLSSSSLSSSASRIHGLPPQSPSPNMLSQIAGPFQVPSVALESSSPRPTFNSNHAGQPPIGRHRPTLSGSSFGSNDNDAVKSTSMYTSHGGSHNAPHSPGSVPNSAVLVAPAPSASRVSTSLLPPSMPLQQPSFGASSTLSVRALRRDHSPFQADLSTLHLASRPPLSPSASPHLPTTSLLQSHSQSNATYSFQGPSYTGSNSGANGVGSGSSANPNYASAHLLASTTTQMDSYTTGPVAIPGFSGRFAPSFRCPSPSTSTSTISTSVADTPPIGGLTGPGLTGRTPTPPGVNGVSQGVPGSPGVSSRTDLSPILRSSIMRDCAHPNALTPSPSLTPVPQASPAHISPAPTPPRSTALPQAANQSWSEYQTSVNQPCSMSLSNSGSHSNHPPPPVSTTVKRPLPMSARQATSIPISSSSPLSNSSILSAHGGMIPGSLDSDQVDHGFGNNSVLSSLAASSFSQDYRVSQSTRSSNEGSNSQIIYGRRSQISQLPPDGDNR